MSEHLGEGLPDGLSEDDLRYVHPQLFPPSMAMQGWNTVLKFDIDGNPYKVDYRLARPLDADFGIEEFSKLASQVGIFNEEEDILPSYTFRIDTFGEGRTEYDALHDAINPHVDTSRLLIFEFCGFPTNQTMDVMIALEKAFQPQPKKGLVSRILGRFSLGTAARE